MKIKLPKELSGHAIPARDAKGLREFGLITGAIIAGLFGLLFPWIFNLGFPYWPWVIATLLWLPALLAPNYLNGIYHGWMRFAIILGYINTRIFLSLLFFLLFSPMGLVKRLFGNDAMRRKPDPKATSYRVESIPNPREQMERPF